MASTRQSYRSAGTVLPGHPIYQLLNEFLIRPSKSTPSTGSAAAAAAAAAAPASGTTPPTSSGDIYDVNYGDDEPNTSSTNQQWPMFLSYSSSDTRKNARFFVPPDKLEDFMHTYANAVSQGLTFHIVERHNDLESAPMLVDLDIHYPPSKPERAITLEWIQSIMQKYHTIIHSRTNFSSDDPFYYAAHNVFVFMREQPAPRIKMNGTTDCYSDGIHLVWPFLNLNKRIQMIIREDMIREFPMLLDDTITLTETRPEHIIDKSVINKNGWFLYGSTKDGYQPYKLICIYNTLTQQSSDLYPADLSFLCNEHQSDEMNTTFREITESMYPIFLSIRMQQLILRQFATPVANDATNRLIMDSPTRQSSAYIGMNPQTYRNRPAGSTPGSSTNTPDYDFIEQLIDMLSIDRATAYTTWIEVILCLHNIGGPDDERMKNIAHRFSEKAGEQYSPQSVDTHWRSIRSRAGNVFTVGSLCFWAKQDNPDEYNKIRMSDIKRKRDDSLMATHGDIAAFFHFCYPDEFRFSGGRWFIWNKHRWIEDDENNILILRKINLFIIEHYAPYLNELFSEILRKKTSMGLLADGSSEREDLEEDMKLLRDKTKKVTEVICKLKTTGFKESVVKECRILYFDAGFYESLNTNPELIGFENGVYDLKNGMFRNGAPEDCLTMTTGYDYEVLPETGTTHHMNFLDDFFSKVFPIERVRKFMMKRMATYLCGINREQKFGIWSGTGGNGKTKLQILLKKAFGDLAYKLSVSVLTSKRAASNAPTPEIAGGRNKRWCFMDEPNGDDHMNIGLLKEWSGGDEIPAREMYGRRMLNFKPQWHLVLLCNNKPKGPADDGGFARRVEIIEFLSRFVYHPNSMNLYEFLRDDNIDEKLLAAAPTFMSMLLREFELLRLVNFVVTVPEEVAQYTNDYIRMNDRYGQFINEYYVITPHDESSSIDINTMYTRFSAWFSEEFSGEPVPNKKAFKDYLTKRFVGKISGARGIYVMRGIAQRSSNPESFMRQAAAEAAAADDIPVEIDPSLST